MDRLITMATFVKVAQAGGFSAAARALNTSPSYVTKQVQQLERLLGVCLLNRTTRSVRLTEAGTSYYDRCVRILAELQDADQIVQGLHSVPSGTLRLNASIVMPNLIDPVIDQFSKLHPNVRIEMIATDRMADLVQEGFDLAIHPSPIVESSLIVRQLSRHQIVVCGAPTYFAGHGAPRHPGDLSQHNCLLFAPSPWDQEWPFRDQSGERRVPVSGNLRSNSAAALRLAALRGHGLLMAPSFLVADDIAAGRLTPVLADYMPDEVAIFAIYPHRRQLPAKARSFIDLLASQLRRDPLLGCNPPSRRAA
jgi:DNA-binding transcriptional LysR family regulator